MTTQKATIENLVFDAAIGAFEAKVHLESDRRKDSVTVRAYLPFQTDEKTVRRALINAANKRHEALTTFPPNTSFGRIPMRPN